MTFLRAARAYAARGFPVFPVMPGGKAPLTAHGEKDGTTDPDAIGRCARRWPTANVGIVPGGAGLFVLDVDVRNFGDETLAALPPLPATPTTLTGGGGLHLWFRRPPELDGLRCKALRVGTLANSGVDVKGVCAGYVVAPPSVHPSGRRYLWEASSRLDETPVAAPPAWLIALVRASGRRAVGHTPQVTPVAADAFALGVMFKHAGWLGRQIRPGVFLVRCPNERAHSQGRPFDGATVIFAPKASGGRGTFYCAHTSACSEVLR